MNLIPTRRGSGQRLNLPLLVGVELANTLRQLFAQTDSICVYGGNIPDLLTVARWLLRLLCCCKSLIALRLVLISDISTAVSACIRGHVRYVLV